MRYRTFSAHETVPLVIPLESPRVRRHGRRGNIGCFEQEHSVIHKETLGDKSIRNLFRYFVLISHSGTKTVRNDLDKPMGAITP